MSQEVLASPEGGREVIRMPCIRMLQGPMAILRAIPSDTPGDTPISDKSCIDGGAQFPQQHHEDADCYDFVRALPHLI